MAASACGCPPAPAANILLAWLLCWTLALGWGTPVLLPQVGGVVQNGPADKAGIQPGDTIVSINGAAVANWQAMADAITQSNGKNACRHAFAPRHGPSG